MSGLADEVAFETCTSVTVTRLFVLTRYLKATRVVPVAFENAAAPLSWCLSTGTAKESECIGFMSAQQSLMPLSEMTVLCHKKCVLFLRWMGKTLPSVLYRFHRYYFSSCVCILRLPVRFRSFQYSWCAGKRILMESLSLLMKGKSILRLHGDSKDGFWPLGSSDLRKQDGKIS